VESYLEQRSGLDDPFFLYYSISPPHCPVADGPEEYLNMYSPDEVPLRPNVDLDTPLPNEHYWWRTYRHDFRYYHLHLPYTEELPEGYGLRELIAQYYGMTTWMDAAVGRMLRALDRTGLAENTIVLFTSDHGDNLGSLGLWQKGGPNEESARIPYVWRWPRGLQGGQVPQQAVASLVDIAPTLIELAGGSAPACMGGQSLAPVLGGATEGLSREGAFIECGGSVAIRTATHMCFLPRDHETGALAVTATQFYDLIADPYELNNLAGTDAQQDVRRSLEAQLRAFDEQTPWMTEGETNA
jgi:choline-sulfatase